MSTRRSTPDSSKSFFENFQAHFNANIACFGQGDRYRKSTGLFTPIRDVYDYSDEFGKAFIAPALAVYALFVSDNKLSEALSFMQMFLEAIVSIVTRPLVTAFQGFQDEKDYQNCNRFVYN